MAFKHLNLYAKEGALSLSVRKHYSSLFLLTAVLAVVMSACSLNAGTSASGLSPSQVLQKSLTVMKSLKTQHMTIHGTASIQASKTSTSSNPVTVGVATTGTGDQQGLDQHFTLANRINGHAANVSEVVSGNHDYIQNQHGKWYDVSSNQSVIQYSHLLTGVTIDKVLLDSGVVDLKLVDHHDEKLNGASVRHLTATFNKAALTQLLQQSSKLRNSFGQQTLSQIISSAKSANLIVDVWIDESTFYISQTEFNLNLVANTSGATKIVPLAGMTTAEAVVNFSGFNQPISNAIVVPSNATATNSLETVFGLTPKKFVQKLVG